MIQFDKNLLTVKYHMLKRVTAAAGGAIVVVDPTDPKKEVRYTIPFAVARKFIKNTKITRYMNPVNIAVMSYGDHVVNLERDLLTNIKEPVAAEEGAEPWKSYLQLFNEGPFNHAVGDNVWFFDGRYVYQFPQNELTELSTGGASVQYLSTDMAFRSGVVNTIDLYDIDEYRSKNVIVEQRGVIAFKADNGSFAVTPPIWKNVEAIGSSAAVETNSRTDHEDYHDNTTGVTISAERRSSLIDQLDNNFALNLNFTLNSAKSISNHFGFESIEPLQLPEIMVLLQTVNIPNLPKSTKSTFSIGLSPSHALAWLMGLLNQADDLDSYLAVRASLKYLTTKGMFHKATTRAESLFIGNEFQIPTQVVLGNLR